MRHNWMPDEISYAGRENLDAGHAAQYDAKEDAEAEDELALLKTYGLSERSELIDFGAGTGQLTMAAAPACARVVAVDVSRIMLAILEKKLSAARLENVDVVQSGFLTYEHPGSGADFVYSRLALHHLPDFWKVIALTRLRGMINTGGILRLLDVVFHFEPDEAEGCLEAWCESLPREVKDGWKRADIEEHIRDEHSTFTWLLESMIARSGFRIEQAKYSPDGIFAGYVARAV